MTAADWIARAHAVTDGATRGPWKLWGMDVMADVTGTSNVNDAIPVARSLMRDERGMPRTFDADFIAESRTLLPAAVAAIDAVLALHRPVWHPDDADGYHCDECGADLTDATPDCPTVRAITAHLDPS